MGVYRTPQGSPIIFFQEPRRLTIYVTAVSRRRRFQILIVICGLLLFIVSWYSSHSFSKQTETSSPSHEILKSGPYENVPTGAKRSQNIPPLMESQKENVIMDIMGNGKISLRRYEEEMVSGLAEFSDMSSNRSYKRQSNNWELFPGSTDHDDNIRITFPARRHSDFELFPNPSEFKIPITIPITRHPKAEMEFSGSVVKHLKGNKQVSYNKPSLQGTTLSSQQVAQPVKETSLILDTPGCKVPKLDPWDQTVRHLIVLGEPFVCPGPPLFMNPSPNASITLNETILENYYGMKPHELRCYYQPIYRQYEDPREEEENNFDRGEVSELHFGVPLNEDYIGAMCFLKDRTFEQYFPLVRLKREIEEVRSAITPPTPRLNVILAGIDSVSKLNYLRHFRKTEALIKEKLNMFEMNGYTKVGDNTFPNLVPMLTGRFVEHYWNESIGDSMFFDNLDFIWKDYAKRGYRTFYAEDSPVTGTFNYAKRGFNEPPTDYYIRPLMLALEKSQLREKTGYEHCYNSQLEPEIIYDYLRNFIETMGDKPYHAFAMVSRLTHDYLNCASWADQPTVHILEDLLNMGALNKSLLVLFSDHGLRFGPIRYTYIGKFEERMPFMYIHAPKWFLDQYPQYAKNLEINQNRLMTLFDIHATMLHLLDLNKSAEERAELSLGRSLLEEISPDRTCEEANILPHYCPCQTFKNVPLNSVESISASQAIVDDINSKLKEYSGICEVLEVAEIMDARVGQVNDLVLKVFDLENKTVELGERIKPIGDYMITLVTKPGHAVFEGTVRHDPENNIYSVLGISRINMYSKTSWCIDGAKLKLFCYCKIQLPS